MVVIDLIVVYLYLIKNKKMKKVKKQIHLRLDKVNLNQNGGCYLGRPENRYTYEFSGHGYIENIDTLEAFVEVEEPETIAEFREQKDLTKTELVDWLNKNYKV